MFFFPVCVWHLNNKIHVFSLAQRNWSRYFSLHARPLYDLPFLQRIQMKHRSKQMLLLLSRKMIIFWFLPLPPSCIISRLIAQNSMGKKHPRRGTKRYRQHHLIRTVVVHHFLKFKFSKWLALRLFFLGKVPSLDPEFSYGSLAQSHYLAMLERIAFFTSTAESYQIREAGKGY